MNRHEIISDFVKDKDVLDLGCINHNLELFYSESLHSYMKKVAKNIVGLDTLEKEANTLNKKGYKIFVGNVEKFSLKQKFDVVVAGEIIEHLSNPGGMLECVNRHLKENGLLIITTPNTYALDRCIIPIIRGGKQPVNPEHTCYYTHETLSELLRRYGFVIEEYFYSNENPDTKEFKGAKSQIRAKIVHALKGVRSHFMETAVYICRKSSDKELPRKRPVIENIFRGCESHV